jgi:hypothetical protein
MEWLDDPAFTGLVHRWLRWVRTIVATNAAPLTVDYAAQLRTLHFPPWTTVISS